MSVCLSLVCVGPTLPRWPISQESACGLLKPDSLCVNQAWRANNFTVHTAATATSPVPAAHRIWQRPAQLRTLERTPWRTDILGQSERSGVAPTVAAFTMRSLVMLKSRVPTVTEVIAALFLCDVGVGWHPHGDTQGGSGQRSLFISAKVQLKEPAPITRWKRYHPSK